MGSRGLKAAIIDNGRTRVPELALPPRNYAGIIEQLADAGGVIGDYAFENRIFLSTASIYVAQSRNHEGVNEGGPESRRIPRDSQDIKWNCNSWTGDYVTLYLTP